MTMAKPKPEPKTCASCRAGCPSCDPRVKPQGCLLRANGKTCSDCSQRQGCQA